MILEYFEKYGFRQAKIARCTRWMQ